MSESELEVAVVVVGEEETKHILSNVPKTRLVPLFSHTPTSPRKRLTSSQSYSLQVKAYMDSYLTPPPVHALPTI